MSTTEYCPYIAMCPQCGEDANWLAWADMNAGAKDRGVHLQIDCQWCALSTRVAV